MPPTVFISYSHEDEDWKDRLLDHLDVFEEEGFFQTWNDGDIGAGDEWFEKIRNAMTAARVAVFLVSTTSLKSKFIRHKEIPHLLDRREKEGLTFFPVIVKPCVWDELPWLSRFQARPRDGKPLADFRGSRRDTELTKIAKEILEIVRKGPQPSVSPGPAAVATSPTLPVPQADLTSREEDPEDQRPALPQGGTGATFGLRQPSCVVDPDKLLPESFKSHSTLSGFPQDQDQMSKEDARDLLLGIAPRTGYESAEIARLCGWLPIALRIAGSVLAERPDLSSSEYIRRLRETRERLDPIEAALTVSYKLLNIEQQRLWRMLVVFPGDFEVKAAAGVWKLEMDSAQEAIRAMAHLIEQKKDAERYYLHDCARQFADRRINAAEREIAQRQHARHYLELIRTANQTYKEGGESIPLALQHFDTEWGNIQAGYAWAASHFLEDDEIAQICEDFPNAGAYLLELRQHPQERIRWIENSILASQHRQDSPSRRASLGNLFGNLGNAYMDLDQPRRAIEYFERLFAIAAEIGDQLGKGIALSNLGTAYTALGDPGRAIEFYNQALAITREISDLLRESQTLSNLGLSYWNLNQTDQAIEFYEQSLAIARVIGDRRGEGQTLGNLGIAYASLGQTYQAIQFHKQALSIARDIDDRREQGRALSNLGLAYADLDEIHQAIGFYQQALSIARDTSDRRGEGDTLGNLGRAYVALGEFQRAIDFYEQSLIIAREIGDRSVEGQVLGRIGIAYRKVNEFRKAIEYYEQERTIARETGNRLDEFRASWNLGLIYEREGELSRAATLMQTYVDFQRENGYSDVEPLALHVQTLRTRIAEQS